MMNTRLDYIMTNMGFSPDDKGPWVQKLREKLSKDIENGLINRSYGSWAEGVILTPEERAKFWLQVDWEIENGFSYEVEALTPPLRKQFDIKTMKSTWHFNKEAVLPWLRDRKREFLTFIRTSWNRNVRGIQNPYK